MRDDKLEEQLRPTRAIDLAGPRRQRLPELPADQVASAQRSVGDHRDAPISGERQQPLLGVALRHGVGDLHEIDDLARDQLRDRFRAARGIVGHAEIPDAAFLFPAAQGVEMRANIEQVVHLHEVDLTGAKFSDGIFHLGDAGIAAGNPHLGRDKQFLPQRVFRHQVAGNFLGAAIHRRRIEDSPAERRKLPQHRVERRALRLARAHIEGLPRAQADHRNFFAGGRNRAREERRLCRRGVGRGPGKASSSANCERGRTQQPQRFSTVHRRQRRK